MVVDFIEDHPHETAEFICLKCLKRYLGVYNKGVLLSELACPECKEKGFIIKTGQELKED